MAWMGRLDSLTARATGRGRDDLPLRLELLRAIEDAWPDSALDRAEQLARDAEAGGAHEVALRARLIGASIGACMLAPAARERMQEAAEAALDRGAPEFAAEVHLRLLRACIQLQDTVLLRSAPGCMEAQGLEVSAARAFLAALLADTTAFHGARRAVNAILRHDTAASRQRTLAMLDMAEAFDRSAQPDSAHRWARQAVKEADACGDVLLIGKALELQAFIEVNMGRQAEAADHLLQALDIYHDLGARWYRPEAERKLAYIYWGSLAPDTVRNRFLHAMALADAVGNARSACAGRLYYGKFLVSMDSSTLARWGIGHAARFDSGLAHVNEAYVRALQLPDRWLPINALDAMAAIKNHQGDFRGSLALNERVLDAYTELGSKSWIARSTGGLLPDLYSLGEYRRVLEVGQRTVRLAQEVGLPDVESGALMRLYWANRMLGNHKAALDQKLRMDTLQDLHSSEAAMEELARANERHKAERQMLADSLAHAQELAVEKATSEARIQRQRTTTWAIGGGGALLLLGAGGYFLLDRKRRRAQFERDAAAFETQALRSQMNPHFIFNALNSISGYIQGNDPDQAQTFLARFAKLMRAVLENSRFTEVPLAKDLEVLRAYMELERTRAQGKFDFSIEVDPALDANEVLVPPLVAQPFVENAIWHGIAGKIGRGHITLRVSQREGQLRIEVVDDGVGMSTRAPSPEKDKTSLGTHITRSRLDLVQKQKGKPAGYRYLETATGTHVEIHLPLELAA